MPYLVTTSTYPPEKASEAAETYFEALKKYPIDENLSTELVPAAVKSTAEGIKVVSFLEVKPGKLEEVLTRVTNFMVMFQRIQGYRYTTEIYYKVEEALAMIGLSLPE
jgi:hypothetical protein